MLLEPGLSMYLPTGTPHAARAQDTVSLHVTLGINQLTWRTLLDRAVGGRWTGSRPTPTCRPATSTDPESLAAGLTERLGALVPRSRRHRRRRGRRAQTRSFLERRGAGLRGGLVDRMELDRVVADTALRRRPGKPCVLRPDGDRLHLLLGDRRVTVPARITEAVERARALEVLTPADLGLDPQSALVLARRLIREGLLEVVR